MPKLTFITPDGSAHSVDAPVGRSVMEVAVKANVPGIWAECGGSCSCATCHVYVDPADANRIGRATPMEEGLLDFSDHKRDTSRLSCQIKVTEALDGVTLHLPPEQG